MTKKIFSVFALGLLVGIIITSLTKNVQTVEASRRRTTPTPTPIATTTPAPPQPKLAGYYQDLTDAVLNGAFLAYHDFSGFTLTNAIIRDANLTAANFDGADLSGVDFTNSNLTNMSYTNANLTGVKWYNCPNGEGACGGTTCPDGTQITTDGGVCF
jgi:hypothetical protein